MYEVVSRGRSRFGAVPVVGGSGRLGVGSWMRERGQAVVELALVMPILILFAVAIADFGFTFSNYLQLTDAVRIAGRAAAAQGPDSNGDGLDTNACNSAESAAQTAMGSNWSSATGWACTPTTIAGATGTDPAVRITLQYPFSIGLFNVTSYSFSKSVGNLTAVTTERLG